MGSIYMQGKKKNSTTQPDLETHLITCFEGTINFKIDSSYIGHCKTDQ